jgi:hypothetical protein
MYVLLVLWMLRSCYFLFSHRMKAVRTRPWQASEEHLPRHMRDGRLEHVVRAGPLEEYVLTETNPDKTSALVLVLARAHKRCRLPLWAALQFSSLFMVCLIGTSVGAWLYATYALCSSNCVEGEESAQCKDACLEPSILLMELVYGLLMLPLPLILCAWLAGRLFSCMGLERWCNRYFLAREPEVVVAPHGGGGSCGGSCGTTQLHYPGKFGVHPCWICWRRCGRFSAVRSRQQARRVALIAAMGKQRGRQQSEREIAAEMNGTTVAMQTMAAKRRADHGQ